MKKTSLGHGTILITISSLVFIISGYLINILLGKSLGPNGYGTYGIVISLMTAINLTQTAGLPQAVAKFIAEDESKSESVLKSGLIIQTISTCLASLVFYFFAHPISELLHDHSLTPYIQTSALIFPLYGIYSIYLNYYNGLHFFKRQAMLNITYALAKLFSVILFVYFFNVYGAIFGFIVSPLIALLFFFHVPRGVKINFPFKKLILFSLPLIAFAILSNLLQSIDLFFVKSLLHIDKYSGYYTANQNIAELPFYGVIALGSILFPSISRNVSLNLHEETKTIISKSLRFSCMVLLPSVVLIASTSSHILKLLYSSAYIPGAEALSILVVGSGFFTFFILLTTIISSSGRPHISALLALAGLVFNSLFCMLLIPQIGMNGAALSTTISSFLVMVIAAYLVYKKFFVLFSFKSLLKTIASSLIIFLLGKLINVPTIMLPLFYCSLGIFYIILLILFKEITSEDKNQLISLLPKSPVKRI